MLQVTNNVNRFMVLYKVMVNLLLEHRNDSTSPDAITGRLQPVLHQRVCSESMSVIQYQLSIMLKRIDDVQKIGQILI